jgi:large subunit ribosomal protein L3
MSETQDAKASAENAENKVESSSQSGSISSKTSIKLPGLYLFKEGMTTVYTEQGQAIPVTVLRTTPWVVTQIKTLTKDGYNAIQVSNGPLKKKNSKKPDAARLKPAGFENGARFSREILVDQLPEGVALGQILDLASLEKGDTVKLTGTSKGKGFAGSVKRFNFAGGPASHGSKFHRRPGSSGNRTWPGRVMPGKKFPGQLGLETVTVPNVKVVAVHPELGTILVKGPVPGSRNSLVRLVRG